jgi:hypothetical protein
LDERHRSPVLGHPRAESQSPVQYTKIAEIEPLVTSARISSRQYHWSPPASQVSSTSKRKPVLVTSSRDRGARPVSGGWLRGGDQVFRALRLEPPPRRREVHKGISGEQALGCLPGLQERDQLVREQAAVSVASIVVVISLRHFRCGSCLGIGVTSLVTT